MQTPQGNILEWFYDDNGYGFDLFIGQKQSVTDGQFYVSPDAAIQAGMTYEEQLSQSQKPPTHLKGRQYPPLTLSQCSPRPG